jgi:hypothetical protein
MDVADDGARGLPLFVYCYRPVKSPLAYVNQPEALLVRDGYHVLVTINIPVNRVTNDYRRI